MPKGYDVNPKRDKRGLTAQQAVFADKVLEVGPVEAARIAYPDATEKSQGEIASQNLVHPDIVLSLSKEAELVGLKKKDCLETIKDGLTASNVSVDLYGRTHESPDYKTRLKAAELGIKIHGGLQERTVVPIPVNKDQYAEFCREFWSSKPK